MSEWNDNKKSGRNSNMKKVTNSIVFGIAIGIPIGWGIRAAMGNLSIIVGVGIVIGIVCWNIYKKKTRKR